MLLNTLITALLLAATPPESAPLPPPDLKVSVIGSSTVWGSGMLTEQSLTGTIDELLRQRWSSSIQPGAMQFSRDGKPFAPPLVRSRKFADGDAVRLEGIGATAEFELEGNELALWYGIERTRDYAKIGIYADGVRIGTIDNRNPTMGEDRREFTGDGKTRAFPLEKPFTYAHRITLDGRSLRTVPYTLDYVTGDVAKRFPDTDALIVRIAPEKKVEHFLYFFRPPAAGSKIVAEFRTGTRLGYTACTVGETDDPAKLESTYGIGNVPFDPANPTSFSAGLDFRTSNQQTLFVHHFPTAAKRRFKLVIESGEQPYFLLDFAANRAHQLQNAGIGGFTAKRFLSDRFGRSLDDLLRDFVPDAAFIILGGNDDWAEGERLVSRRVPDIPRTELEKIPAMPLAAIEPQPDGRFTLIRKSALIDAITPTSLRSAALRGNRAVRPGHFVRIGNYYGDNRSTAVRVIAAVAPEAGEIRWRQPLDPAAMVGIGQLGELAGQEFTIRTLAGYQANIEQMMQRLWQANPAMKIVLLNTYTPNYFLREVWGYAEALENLAARYPGRAIAADATPAILRWSDGELTGKSFHEFKSTGAARYELPWKMHHQGYRVLVDGQERYGRNCHILSGWYYAPQEQNGRFLVGRTRNEKRVPQQLVFTAEPPPPGATIRVIRADRVWSSDFAHPTPAGARVIGEVAATALEKIRDNAATGFGKNPD